MKERPRTVVRSQAMYDKYVQYKETAPEGCPLCKADPIKEYKYWKLIPNDFPYDVIAQEHCMLIPKDHTGFFKDLSEAAKSEYYALLKKLDHFDSLFNNFQKNQTIPEHFHVHLITYKLAQ
ncbi:MAG: hypothetical protein WD175_01030 [Candidatus Paceibacterota bacterium]